MGTSILIYTEFLHHTAINDLKYFFCAPLYGLESLLGKCIVKVVAPLLLQKMPGVTIPVFDQNPRLYLFQKK